MDNSWVKLYRKILENDNLFRSSHTFTLWCWLLLKANREGVVTVGRYMLADWLKIKPSTVYQTLKRLENMTMIEMKSNNKMTTVKILNWSKYQSKPSSQESIENEKYSDKVADIQHQSNTKQEYKNKNKEYNIIADKPQSSSKSDKQERLPVDEQKPIHRVCYHLEDTLHAPIINWGKQAKALSLMLKAGYTEQQILKTITYMAKKDDFFKDKGFDLMTVANTIGRYKAEAEKRRGVAA